MKLDRANLQIALVDDEENDCELLQAALAEAGFKRPLTYLRNGEIALEYFKYLKARGAAWPHLLMLDINMPVMGGVDALRLLREASSFRNLPVIILTGSEDTAKRRDLAHLGIFRFLKKQPNGANVISALDDFIGLYNHEVATLVA